MAHRQGIRRKDGRQQTRPAGLALGLAVPPAASWSRSYSYWATSSVQTTERYLGCTQRIVSTVNDRIGIEPAP
jgi:hypothetical protein